MAGNYTCKPYNSWGSSGTSTVIRVVVEEQEETEEEVDKEVDKEEVDKEEVDDYPQNCPP